MSGQTKSRWVLGAVAVAWALCGCQQTLAPGGGPFSAPADAAEASGSPADVDGAARSGGVAGADASDAAAADITRADAASDGDAGDRGTDADAAAGADSDGAAGADSGAVSDVDSSDGAAGADSGAVSDVATNDAAVGDGAAVVDSATSDVGAGPGDALGDTPDGSAATDAATAYDPDQPPAPIPALGPEPAPPCAAALAKADYFQFLDDLCAAKVEPTHVDAALACPVVDVSATVPLKGGGSATYTPFDAPLLAQTAALDGLLPQGMAMSVLLVKRVGGTPHLRLLGTPNHEQAVQPWSTTKWLAAANAAATMRVASNYKVGLTASVKGTAIGDFVSSIHTYDNSPYNSNGLARWFHDIGGRAKANALIHEAWLGRPASETFGGNYGSASPPLGYSFVEADGAALTVVQDKTSGPANHLSPLTLALALERVVLHREQPTTRLPGIQWKDIEVLLYGAAGSKKYGPFGGMSADTAIYAQAGLDMPFIEQRSKGKWRIHSKLGLGTGYQFVWVGYACLPWLDAAGAPIAGWGREVVMAVHLPTGGKDWRERDRLVAKGVRAVLTRVVDGRL